MGHPGFSQEVRLENIIDVDTLYGLPNKSLPFDQPFILNIPTKSNKVKGLSYFKHVRNMNFGSSFYKRSPVQGPIPLPVSAFKVETRGTKKYITIKVTDKDHFLDPGSTYTYLWAEDVTPEMFSLFDFYYKWKFHKDTTGLAKSQKIYAKIGNEIYNKFNMPINWPNDPSSIANLGRISQSFNDTNLTLPTSYYDYEESVKNWNTILDRAKLIRLTCNNCLLNLLAEINKRGSIFDHDLRSKYLKSETLTTKRLIKIQKIFDKDTTQVADLFKGKINIDCDECERKIDIDYKSRKENFKNSIIALDETILISKAIYISTNDSIVNSSINLLQYLRTTLRMLSDSLDPVQKKRDAIETQIFNQALSQLTTLGTSTFIYNFETRNKLTITPDFGVVTSMVGGGKNNPYPFVPYLGFHINLRPINRDVKFYSYNHKWSHLFSIMFGYSMVPISTGPKLSKNILADSLSGFFKDNSTLLTGIGFRLGNVIRITGGSMWHFKTTANDASVYDNRKLKSWLFLGLSLDLSFKDLFNGIVDVFKGAPTKYTPPPPNNVITPSN